MRKLIHSFQFFLLIGLAAPAWAVPDDCTEIRARHILVWERAEAVRLIEELDRGADFADLARQHSTGPSSYAGGDLGYFDRLAMVSSFSRAAFALPVGGYTRTPVQTEFGWHVIKAEDCRTQSYVEAPQVAGKPLVEQQEVTTQPVEPSPPLGPPPELVAQVQGGLAQLG